MSADLAVFNFGDQEIRTVVIDGDPWFIARDVCLVLGIANGRDAVSRLDADGVGTADVIDSMGRTQTAGTINEAGLYELIFQSRRPEARAFRRWVTSEVLPQIRRTGSFGAPSVELDLTNRKHVDLIVQAAHAQMVRAEDAEARVAELEPAAEAWNHLAQADGDYDVAEAAKVLARDLRITIGRDRLFTLMAEMGWTYRERSTGRWQPKQTQIDLGRLSVLPKSHYHPRTGELVLDPPQVRVTAKGVAALHAHLSRRSLPAVAS